MKIETQEQFREFVDETIPSALFHVETKDIDDETGASAEDMILLRLLSKYPEALKFKPLRWFIGYFLK